MRHVLIVFLMVLLAACSEPVPMTRTAYVGDWAGPDMRLSIRTDGHVDYERKKPNGSSSISAPISKWDGHDFLVGVGIFSTRFVVSQPPIEREGVWTMVVDGVPLRRVGGGGDHVWTSVNAQFETVMER
ncbi:MAG: hypothetical protein SF172_12730 [Burkholderiales bacterium]|nr:hypothetical protein [Burkholderiales bacterium]